jgi:(p)ppGpp synthase/HD superfamily hydrolase
MNTLENLPNDAALVALAAAISRKAHAGQFRRDGTTPYVSHPEAVAGRVKGDALAEAVAWLHDVLEDSDESEQSLRAQGLPDVVVACVAKLTHAKDMAYEPYLAAIKTDPLAKKVKVADMLTNLSDTPTEKQIVKYAKGLLILYT